MDITSNKHGGADTSVIAYESTPSKIREKHKAVLLHTIEEQGNATGDELARMLEMPHQTVSARMSELKRDERILDTGERRLTQLGRPARVYKINEVKNGIRQDTANRHD